MKITNLLLACVLASPFSMASAGEVEVLHWWTSGGEARSVELLKEMLRNQGHEWRDFAVAGKAGESAMNTLRIRAISGNPPDAAQIKGPEIQEWGKLGFLTSLDEVAEQQHWDDLLPTVVTDIMKVNGHYVGAPFNVHRVNWLWVNPDVFKKSGAKIPETLEEFFVAADKIRQAGYIPLALGNESWQETTLFESIALAILGSHDYRRAIVEGDSDIVTGDRMVQVFKTFRKMKGYTDAKSPGRNWSDTTALVINGEAAMQFMGDWAKGEFAAAGKVAGEDYLCVPAPGTRNQYTFNIDSLVFFKSTDESKTNAQKALASQILDPAFQRQFNLSKGSIPVRVDMDMSGFDHCAEDSMDAFLRAATTGNLVPSLSHDLATSRAVQSTIFDVVRHFYENDHQTAEQAVIVLDKTLKAANY